MSTHQDGATPAAGTDQPARYRHHPHVPHPSTVADLGQFNSRMVGVMASVLGSVRFIWFCIALDTMGLAGLVYQISQLFHGHGSLFAVLLNTCLLVTTFAAQAVIQLIALPVLQNYQNRQTAADEAKMDADHQALSYVATGQDLVRDALDPATGGGLQVIAAAIAAARDDILAAVTGHPPNDAPPLEVR